MKIENLIRLFHQIYRKRLSHWAISIIFLILIFFLNRITLANEVNKKSQSDSIIQNHEYSDIPRIVKIGDKTNMQIFPSGDLYPRYIADPRRPQNGIMTISLYDNEIIEGGVSRYHLCLGGRFGILKFFKSKEPDHGIEVSAEAGFLGQFNRQGGLDNNGWDGLYGIIFTYRPDKKWAYKIGLQHDSSHIGDEYIENTGATRIDYTREEITAGISLRISPLMHLYTEFGNAYRGGSENQENLRIQGGTEITGPFNLFHNSSGLYGAIDMVSWEENDWKLSITVQAGILIKIPESKRIWRFGIQYYNGRSHIGEFYQFEESYLGIGIWVDI